MNDMKKMTLLTGILLCLLVSSCGKDEETETGGATGGDIPVRFEVPTDIIGKDLHFGTGSDNLFFSLLQTNKAVKIVMKDGWNVRDASCTYKKISENSASLRVDFGLDLGLEQMLKHSYVMDLRFSSKSGGDFSSIHRWEYDGIETEVKDDGIFGYDTGDTEIFENEPEKPDVDFGQLYHSWLCQKGDTARYLTFRQEDMSYLLVTKAKNFYKEEKGNIRIIPDAYLLSLMPEGTEERIHYRVQLLDETKLTWLSYLAATGAPVDPETFLPSETDGVEAADLTEDVIYMKPATISPNHFSTRFYWKAGEYKIEGETLTVGICYGTSPHPQITDEVSDYRVVLPIGEEKEEGSAEFSIDDLKPATTYYARRFTIIDGNPVYFQEFSVETVGNRIQAELKKEGFLKMKISYKINQPGTYHIRLQHFSTYHGGVYHEDFGYKKQGDSDSFSYNCIYSMGSAHNFCLHLTDIETGIIYQSNRISYMD